MTEGEPKPSTNTAGAIGGPDVLSGFRVSLDADRVVERMAQAARRGKLPEFARGGPENALFRASALGQPFDRDLLVWARGEGPGLALRFGLRWRRKAPILYAAALVFTVEPGRYFLELMIPGSWGWGSIMWWYYPLTILPIVPSWLYFVRKSRQSTLDTAVTSHGVIRGLLSDSILD